MKMKSLLLAVALLLSSERVAGHGNLLYPQTWQDASGYFGAWILDNSQPGAGELLPDPGVCEFV